MPVAFGLFMMMRMVELIRSVIGKMLVRMIVVMMMAVRMILLALIRIMMVMSVMMFMLFVKMDVRMMVSRMAVPDRDPIARRRRRVD